jgi:hypothetical protein
MATAFKGLIILVLLSKAILYRGSILTFTARYMQKVQYKHNGMDWLFFTIKKAVTEIISNRLYVLISILFKLLIKPHLSSLECQAVAVANHAKQHRYRQCCVGA